MRRITLAVLVLLAVVAPTIPARGDSEGAPAAVVGARAWAVRVTNGGDVIGLQSAVDVDPIADTAAARPLVIGANEPGATHADAANPHAEAASVDWADPSGSVTMAAGYAEADAGPSPWTARAGAAAPSGTGIAMASKLLTWDQQEQLGNALVAFNNAVLPVLQTLLDNPLTVQIFKAAGLNVPTLAPLTALGIIDTGRGRASGATAEAAAGPGFASAHADATLGQARLLGGFITVDAVSVDAAGENGTSGETASAHAWVSGVSIAGIPVTVDEHGLAVAGGTLLGSQFGSVLQTVLGALAAAGIRITAGTAGPSGPHAAQAAGLTVSIGPIAVELGHAEAIAPDPLPVPATHPATTAAPTVPTSSELWTDIDAMASTSIQSSQGAGTQTAATATASPTAAAAPQAGDGLLPTLGADVVRALRGTFLLLTLGGAGGAFVLPFFAGLRRPDPKRETS